MGLFSRKTTNLTNDDKTDMQKIKKSLKQLKMEMPTEIVAAHGHSSDNKNEISKSNRCSCFYCLESFPSDEVRQWVNGENTAICPNCGIDSVIGDASGLSLNKEFLISMKKYWF